MQRRILTALTASAAILLSFGNQGAEAISDNTQEREATVDNFFPQNSSGEGPEALSAEVPFGIPTNTPPFEAFAGCVKAMGPMVRNRNGELETSAQLGEVSCSFGYKKLWSKQGNEIIGQTIIMELRYEDWVYSADLSDARAIEDWRHIRGGPNITINRGCEDKCVMVSVSEYHDPELAQSVGESLGGGWSSKTYNLGSIGDIITEDSIRTEDLLNRMVYGTISCASGLFEGDYKWLSTAPREMYDIEADFAHHRKGTEAVRNIRSYNCI